MNMTEVPITYSITMTIPTGTKHTAVLIMRIVLQKNNVMF